MPEIVNGFGLPISSIDCEQSICAQLDDLLKVAMSHGRNVFRIDVGARVFDLFTKQLLRMADSQRASTNSISDAPGIWKWRRVPIVLRPALPDAFAAVVMQTPEKTTFRGQLVTPKPPTENQ